ncbi:uncharacterized protein LOC119101368 [Pollicipes pollicipes]|uniref:uncharacterized protein LOC119101368 n=1 Tax=Pollicipes pollicipes TaxID=41117 RepID=UPI0018854DA2|nr:uncharacterized protein LOC119101368 [Pollicipes pollicipes]
METARILVMVGCLAVMMCGSTQAASIIFPTTSRNASRTRLPQLVFTEEPACIRRSEFGMCETIDEEYPTEIIKEALAQSNNAPVAELASGDDTLVELAPRFGGNTEMENRLVEETAACTATESIIYPKMAKNDKNQWLFVVNSAETVQGIRVEKCVDEGKQCKIASEGTVCRQKYIYRKMLAVNGSGKMATDNFRIPSCCVCYIKNEFLAVRFNTSPKRKNSTASSRIRSRPARQAGPEPELEVAGREPELEVVGGETAGLSGSPLDNALALAPAEQGTAQQSIETEETFNPSDTIGGQPVGRFAGEIIVHSNPIVVKKKPPKQTRRRN